MQLAFSWWQLFDVLLSILWLISGVRDFMGKDPLIRLPFNQYERDPEYRAFWQKKKRRVLHAQQHRLSDFDLHTCYIADLPHHLRHRHRGRSSLSGCLRGLGAQRRLTRRERSVP